MDHRFQAVMGEVGGSIRKNGSPVVLDVRIAIDSFFFLFFFMCMYVCIDVCMCVLMYVCMY